MRTNPYADTVSSPHSAALVSPVSMTETWGLESWIQVNLALSTHLGSFRTSSWPLLEQLQTLLQTWRQTAPVACWFVRKSPGIRLRLSGPGFDAPAHSTFVALLDHEVVQGNLERWWYSTYEPEIYRLGGPIALQAVHRLLSADTTVWLNWQRLFRQGETLLSEDVMALALYSDLLLRATEDHAEAWDIWCALHRIYAEALPEEPRGASLQRHLLLPQELQRLAKEAERACLDTGFAANVQFAQALEQVWEQGALVGGRRALLATLASFHWNIWCLRPQVVAPLCQVMVRELHPASDFLPSVTQRQEG